MRPDAARGLGAALVAMALSVGLSTGCPDVPQEGWTRHVTPLYVLDPEAPEIPTPIDIPGVTVEVDDAGATAGVEVAVPADASAAYDQLFSGYVNTLDGWALNSGIEFAFTDLVRHETVTPDTVMVIDFSGAAPTRIEGLVPVAEDDPETGRTVVTIAPPTPLPADAVIGVVVRSGGEDGVLDSDGDPVVAAYTFSFLKSRTPLADVVQNPDGEPRVESNIVVPADTPEDVAALLVLEALRTAYAPALDALEAGEVAGAPPVARDEVVLFWTFTTQSDTIAQFDPAVSVIPTPNDVLRSDGSLSFPIEADDPAAQKALFGWLNERDGFSVLSAPEVAFSGPIDPATATPGSVRVFDITAPAAIAEVGDLVRAWDDATDTLALQHDDPSAPFEHGHTYAVVVLSGPETEGGDPTGVLTPEGGRVLRSQAMALALLTEPLVEPGTGASLLPGVLSDADAQQFEPIRAGLDQVVDLLGDQYDVDRGRIAAAWVFTTGTEPESLVDPAVGALPTPNDVVLLASTLNDLVANAQSEAEAAFFTWLGEQGGWSGVISGDTAFSAPLDPATIPTALHVFRLEAQLVPIEDIVFDLPADGPVTRIAFHRAQPWTAGKTYVVVVTDDLRTEDGAPLVPSSFEVLVRGENALVGDGGRSMVPALLSDADARSLELLRVATAPALGRAIEALGISRDDVLAHWTFTTHDDNEALFSPSTGFLPFPNEVLQNPTLDTALDPPRPLPGISLPLDVPPDSPLAPVLGYLATRDGFSVVDPATTTFLGPVDIENATVAAAITDVPTTAIGFADISQLVIEPGASLALDDLLTKLTVVEPLVAFDATTNTLAVGPPIGRPLRENRRMLVELTDQLESADGAPIRVSPTYWLARNPDPLAADGESLVSSLSDADAVQLEQLRQAYAPLFEGFDAVGNLGTLYEGFSRDSVIMFWTYWTQSIRAELVALGAAAAATPVDAGDITGVRREPEGLRQHPTLGPIIDEAPDEITLLNLEEAVVDGAIPGRYLLSDTNLANPADPQYGTFGEVDPAAPAWSDSERFAPVTFDLYVPKQSQAFQAPFDLVVYVHGVFGRRQDVLRGGLLDALLGQGFAVLAIDLPLHGERRWVFDEGVPSGDGFLAPDLLALRDHLVQGALDLHQVANAVRTGLNTFLTGKLGRQGAVVKTDGVHLMGVSLGAVVAVPFMATDPIVARAVLQSPGGHFSRVVRETGAPWFQRSICELLCGALGDANPDLCAFDPDGAGCPYYAGLDWSDPALAQVLTIVQWVLDPADPVAHAPYVGEVADRELFLQLAGADELFPPTLGEELAAALQYDADTGPLTQVYDEACHAFLAEGCAGAGPSFEAVRRAARDDAAAFLRTGAPAP